MESFLFFSPFRRLPFGSFESDVNGFPFFRGLLTKKREKALLAAVQANMSIRLTRKQRTRFEGE
jgi:ribosomal protein S6E (S10)